MTGSGITTISGREDFPVEVEDSTAAEHPETGNEQTEKTLVSLDDDFPRRTTRIHNCNTGQNRNDHLQRRRAALCRNQNHYRNGTFLFRDNERENTQNTST